ncbi:ABC transporter transmembrane domain-containing protein [Paracoccaceae bacterium]|nr:ABC transporter transmembrane domain-containing protein [Paracoccaceae bacterium]
MSQATRTKERAPSKKLGGLSGLLPFLLPYKGLIAAACLALIVTAGLSLVLPLAVRRVIDTFNIENEGMLDLYFGAILVVAALLAAGTAIRYALVTKLGERVVTDIRETIFKRVLKMSPQFYETIMTGEVISRITTDTTLILSVIGSSISVALRNILIFLGGIALMLFTSLKLTGLVLLIVPAVVIPILTLGRKLRRLSRENQDWIASSSGNASEALGAVQTIQAYTHEKLSIKAFNEVSEKAFHSARRRISTRAWMTAIVIFFVFSGIVGVLWIGARDVRSGTISTGVLVQFVIYAVMVAGAVAALSEILGELQRAAGATERLVELLNLRDFVKDPAQAKEFKEPVLGEIEFDLVDFEYPSRPDNLALSELVFKIEPGETVAFVGPSGAGKSTIFQLLLRFYDPKSGRVKIDGIDIKELSREKFRNNIAVVPQDPIIFAMSTIENIRFGRPSASDEDVFAAAKAASAHDFIKNLPESYETFVGERGVMLSGGQKQRIAIARAILRDAPILLLDEATSALDSENELSVKTAVEALSQNRTTLIVAHRLATVKKADRIIVLNEGKVVATGTHEELLANGGLYARLAKLQFSDGKDLAA